MTADFVGFSVLVRSKLRGLAGSFTILALLIMLGGPAFPQGNNGRILGTVTDSSGGYVVGASVTITDVAPNREAAASAARIRFRVLLGRAGQAPGSTVEYSSA